MKLNKSEAFNEAKQKFSTVLNNPEATEKPREFGYRRSFE